MPSTPFLIRYPGGDAELYWGTEAPSVGDTIRRRDGDWIVSRVEASLEGARERHGEAICRRARRRLADIQ